MNDGSLNYNNVKAFIPIAIDIKLLLLSVAVKITVEM